MGWGSEIRMRENLLGNYTVNLEYQTLLKGIDQ
jgi:hypothetical protein